MAASPLLVDEAGVTSHGVSGSSLAPGLWLSILFASLLLLPPLPFPMGNAGAHAAPFVALLTLPAGIRLIRGHALPVGSLPILLLAFWGVLFVSLPFAAAYSGPGVALGSLVRVLLFGISIYVFFIGLTAPEIHASWDAMRVSRVLLCIAVGAAAFACIDFYFQFHAPARFAMQHVRINYGVMRRAQGLFYETSTLANFCVFFLAMVMVAAFPVVGRRVFSPWLLGSGALLFGTTLIFSGSRAALAAVAASVCAFAILRRVRLKGILIALASCLAAVLLVRMVNPAFWASYWFRLAGSATGIWAYPNEVLAGRLANWQVLLDFLARHPWHLLFGIGYKTIPYTSYIGAHVIADNTWLSVLVETGIIGVLVFALLNAAILRTALRAARSPRPEAAFFGAWMFCFWCAEMVQMLTADVMTYWRVLPVYFWVLAVAARELPERSR